MFTLKCLVETINRKALKPTIMGVFILLLSGCGTSHLNCDTEENQALLKQEVLNIIDEYLQTDETTSNSEQKNAYPEISVVSFNQHIADVNAKKCDYIISAMYKNSGTTISNVAVSAVFRSITSDTDSHELSAFTLTPMDASKLGIAAVKNR